MLATAALGQGTPSMTVVTAASTSVLAGQADAVTITVSSGSSSQSATPTGSVQVIVDGSVANSSLALSNGSATYNFSSSTVGSHTIQAQYSGNATYSASTGAVTVAVVSQTFVLSATSPTVSAGSAATSTVTITPLNGYTGTVNISVNANDNIAIPCFSAPEANITNANPVNVTLTIQTAPSGCASSAGLRRIDQVVAAGFTFGKTRGTTGRLSALAIASFGLLLIAIGFRPRKLRLAFGFAATALLCCVLAGCGSSSSTNIKAGT